MSCRGRLPEVVTVTLLSETAASAPGNTEKREPPAGGVMRATSTPRSALPSTDSAPMRALPTSVNPRGLKYRAAAACSGLAAASSRPSQIMPFTSAA